MSYYKYDKKTLEEIKNINEKISKEQQQIFDILLKISQSFSDENFTKEKRNELFSEVDVLKENIKEYNEKLKEIKLNKNNKSIESKNEKQNLKQIETQKDVEKIEKKSEEFVNTVEKLEDTLKESEKVKNKDNEYKQNEDITISKRKKARTQLVVVEDDDSLSGKIKDFFTKLRRIIKK